MTTRIPLPGVALAIAADCAPTALTTVIDATPADLTPLVGGDEAAPA